jgi:hypothetical protein
VAVVRRNGDPPRRFRGAVAQRYRESSGHSAKVVDLLPLTVADAIQAAKESVMNPVSACYRGNSIRALVTRGTGTASRKWQSSDHRRNGMRWSHPVGHSDQGESHVTQINASPRCCAWTCRHHSHRHLGARLGRRGRRQLWHSAVLLGPRLGFSSFAPTAASARGLGDGIAHGNTVQATSPNVTISGVLIGLLEPAVTRPHTAAGSARGVGAVEIGLLGASGSGGGLPANPKQPHPK